jgi:beta-glucanase (GH16 family)
VQTNYFVAGKGNNEKLIDLGFDAAYGFHTYAFEWRRNSIEWFIDGRSVRKVTRAKGPLPSHPGKVGAFIWATQLSEWAGGFTFQNEFPITIEYDYISYTPLSELRDQAAD